MRTIPIINTKIQFDYIIELLRTEINKLTWVGKHYPAVKQGIKENLNVPIVYQNNGTIESLIIIPSNEEKSIVFFEKLNASFEKNIDLQDSYTCNLICWYNLQAIKNLSYDYSEELVFDLLNVLREFDVSNITVNYNYKFENYNFINLMENQFLMYPYGSFLINFTIRDFPC